MLSFLDAGVNVKGTSNENFAREIMELITMGPGNYTEKDILEAARAFTGRNYVDLKIVVDKAGRLDDVDVVDRIMEQPVTAEFISAKLYRFFVRDDVSPELKKTAWGLPSPVALRDRAAAACGRHVQETRSSESPRCARLQLGNRSAGATVICATDGRRPGLRQQLDYAWSSFGTRELRPRYFVSHRQNRFSQEKYS